MKKYISILIATIVLAGVVCGAPGDQETYNSTSAFKESWDPVAKAFVWKDTNVLYKRINGSDTNKKPEELTTTGTNREVVAVDNRNFKFANTGVAALGVVLNETSANFLIRVDNAAPDAINNLNPKGAVIRSFIQNVLYQSWEYMTHNLNKDRDTANNTDATKLDNRRNLLRKIWEYRQWHHDYLLYETKTALNATASAANLYDSAFGRLTEWSAAGSTTLTSDIDVNLKGTNTEAAVTKYNELFLADGWKYEPGVVYDVNVYAVDYLHKEATFGSGMVTKATANNVQTTSDLHGNVLKVKNTTTDVTTTNNTASGTGLAGKEGARNGLIPGGFTTVKTVDIANQDVWTHVKARLYMTSTQFDSYAANNNTGIGIATKVWAGVGTSQNVKAEALARYTLFYNELTGKMNELLSLQNPVIAITGTATGITQLNEYAEGALQLALGVNAPQGDELEAAAANLLMSASNRIYEAKLEVIYTKRNLLKADITAYNANPTNNAAIETKLLELRNLISEAALFANEAYLTDAAVNLVVVGIQGGVPLTSTNNESVNSVVENMADSVKEIVRHGGTLTSTANLGESSFKAAKYMYRLADAAINMGYVESDVSALYYVGNKISNTIKNDTSLTSAQQYTESAAAIQSQFSGVTTPEQLNAKVREIAIAVIKWTDAQAIAINGFGNLRSAAVSQNGLQEHYNATTALPESWDPVAKAFVWKDTNVLYKRINGSDTNKKPEELTTTGTNREVVAVDNRNFKFANTGVAALGVVLNETPANFLIRVDNAAPDAINNLNPKGAVIRSFIQNVLYQSWEYMTHNLNKDRDTANNTDATKLDNRRNLLRKIWEYRQWHHDYLLYETKTALNATASAVNLYDSAFGRLTEWSAAGSTTLTSDIDVNLKGTNTEAAVTKYNELFLADGWKYEPGVVYDVNVYAVDYLHKEATFGSGMVTKATANNVQTTSDLHGNVLKVKNTTTDVTTTNNTASGTGLAGKEGARNGLIPGGFTTVKTVDIANQDVWTHVKARLYMTSTQFDSYAANNNTGIGIATKAWAGAGTSQNVKAEALARYTLFYNELKGKMNDLLSLQNPVIVVTGTATGITQLNEYAEGALQLALGVNAPEGDELKAAAANLLMSASNRIYEAKLEVIYTKRNLLKADITAYNANPTNNAAIETKLLELRNLISEAALFANEAYLTDAAVNLVVVGIQGGVPLTSTNNESVNSVVENMADSVKEIVRHGGTLTSTANLGESSFKAAKYMYRLADAAINMGYVESDVSALYYVGNKISNTIKNDTSLTSAQQYTESAAAIQSQFSGVTTPEQLNAKVREIAIAVIKWTDAQALAINGFGNLRSAAVSQNGLQEHYNATTALPESWDPVAKAFVWKDTNVLYKRINGSDTNKKPEELTTTDTNREVVAVDNRNFKFANTGVAALGVVLNETPANFLIRVDNAAPDAINNLNPKGAVIRSFIQNVLYQSWEYMTHNLNKDRDTANNTDATKLDNRRNLLRKIWEYRQWHHDYLLYETKTALNATASAANLYDSAFGRLTEWSAAGSTTLTSDIDVNLKGTNTEAAVKKYNELFLADGWKYEPGVVYDVNVYAVDYLHKEATFGSGMVTKATANNVQTTSDLHGNVLKVKNTTTDVTTTNNTASGTGLAGKEGARNGLIPGGFTTVKTVDIANQDVWTHVKARLYMTSTQFDSYAANNNTGIGIATKVWAGVGTSQNVKAEALARYTLFYNELTGKMNELLSLQNPVIAVTGTATGITQLNEYAEGALQLALGVNAPQGDELEAAAANLLMSASNRIYEAKLEVIYTKRNLLKADITAYNANPTNNAAIETKLLELRNLISEAALFANEAYLTDAAVNLVVVGIQGGVPLTSTNNESVNSVVENMADSVKEIVRHGGTLTSTANLGESSFKAAKYMYRLADAAINMGYVESDVSALYYVGNKISNTIKNDTSLTSAQQYTESAAAIQSQFSGVTTPEQLNAKVREIAIAVIKWTDAQALAINGFGNLRSAAVSQNGLQEHYNATTAFLESWDPEEEAFVWKDTNVLYKRKNESDTDKQPEELTITGTNRVVVDTDNRFFKFENLVDGTMTIVPNETPDEFLTRLDGTVTNTIRNLNPKGAVVRRLMQNVLYESWEYMTEKLIEDGTVVGNEENRRILLKKIWEYRQWHHDYMLYQTMSAVNAVASTNEEAALYDNAFGRLTEWSAAGSTTLTSDIDVNLKGRNTEVVVNKFNELFIADGWSYEAGVVYDVNVYAVDFMHKEGTFGKGMVNTVLSNGDTVETTSDLHGNVLKVKTNGDTTTNNTASETGFVGKEGARNARLQGGFVATNATDIANQHIWPHVKARIYMTAAEFTQYCTDVGITNQTRDNNILPKYTAFRDALTAKMRSLLNIQVFVESVNGAASGALTGIEQLNKYAEEALTEALGPQIPTGDKLKAVAANLLMAASNRVYEEKLVLIYAERILLKQLITAFDNTLLNNRTQIQTNNIEAKLVTLRDSISEAALFANEAYVTDGAVNHTVVGIQVGLEITITNNESCDAVIENMADALKEANRHSGSLGEAAFKSGKYTFRLADAAINMGYRGSDIFKLYRAGREISVTIKKTVDDPDVQITRSAQEIGQYFPDVTTVATYKAKIRTIVKDFMTWKNGQDVTFGTQSSEFVGIAAGVVLSLEVPQGQSSVGNSYQYRGGRVDSETELVTINPDVSDDDVIIGIDYDPQTNSFVTLGDDSSAFEGTPVRIPPAPTRPLPPLPIVEDPPVIINSGVLAPSQSIVPLPSAPVRPPLPPLTRPRAGNPSNRVAPVNPPVRVDVPNAENPDYLAERIRLLTLQINEIERKKRTINRKFIKSRKDKQLRSELNRVQARLTIERRQLLNNLRSIDVRRYNQINRGIGR